MAAAKRRASALFSLAAAWVVATQTALAEQPGAFDYLYVNASEGSASGGHAAIRFGTDVYHFEYESPGFLKATRESSESFLRRYSDAENRSIHVSRVLVSKETYQELEAQFERRYLIQTEQILQLQSLERDRHLLADWLAAGRRPPATVGGAALFLPIENPTTFGPWTDDATTALMRLQRKLEIRLGSAQFRQRQSELRDSVLRLQPEEYDLSKNNEVPDHLPVRYSFGDRYRDLAAAWLALTLMEHPRPPRTDALLMPADDTDQLAAPITEALSRFRDDTEAGLIRLMQSQRPDWAYAMLVGMARLVAIEISLRRGQLVVLNTFPNDTPPLEHQIADDLAFRRALAEQAKARVRSAFADFVAEPTERSYSLLELAANMNHEIRSARDGKLPLRVHPGNLSPAATALVTPQGWPQTARLDWTKKLASLDAYRETYARHLENRYRYDLLTRNCVTEIFATIDAALAGHGSPGVRNLRLESVARLGGFISLEPARAIPFLSSWAVEHTYRLIDAQDLPSYRLRRLDAMTHGDHPVTAYLRETNVLSSTIYHWHDGDSAFLFFTDGQIWPRPLFGAFNTAIGLMQGTVGIFASPFDGGETLISGLRGVLVSLPELLFFNIRKGYFPAAIIIPAVEVRR